MVDVMSGCAAVSEVILISDDEDSTEINNRIPASSDAKVNIKKEHNNTDEAELKNGKEQGLIVPIKKCDDQELLHRANYQVSPVLVKMTGRANEVMKKFLSACQPLMRSIDDGKILEGIRRDVQQANLHYLASEKFYNVVKFLAESVTEDPKNVFVYIKELSDNLRAYKDRSPKAQKTSCSANGDASHSSALSGEEGKDVNGTVANTSTSKAAASGNETSSSVEHSREACSDPESEKKNRMIRKLTRHLQKLERAAKKLEEKEVDWDDPDDVNSPYLMESRIKAKAMLVWGKICELEGRRAKTGREVEKKLRYSGSRYPEVNRSIENFVNKRKIFPDFTDVLSIIKSQNEESNLGLRDCQVHNVAEEVFGDVGKLLQQRRQKDDFSLAMARLANDEAVDELKDPAEEDVELQKKLAENSEKAKQRLNEVIDTFVHKQMEMKLEPQEVKEENCDQSPPPSPKPEKKETGEEGNPDEVDDGEEEDESEDDADMEVVLPRDDDDSDDSTEGGEDGTPEGDEGNSEEALQADSQTEDSQSSLPEKDDAVDLKATAVIESPVEELSLDQKVVGQEKVPTSKVECTTTKGESERLPTQASASQHGPQHRTGTQPGQPEPEVIEIPSDDDDDVTEPPLKKPKL